MKILLVNKYLMPKGGAETYVFELGKQLAADGHDVQYFGMDHPDRIVGNEAEAYVSYLDFHESPLLERLLYPFKIIYSREAAKKIRRVLDVFQPDIVHLNNFNYQLTPSILYAVRRYARQTGRRIKIVATAHDLQLVCPNHAMLNPITRARCEKCAHGAYFSCIAGRCIHGSRMRSVLGAVEGALYRALGTYRLIDFVVYPSRFIAEKLRLNPALRRKDVVLHNFVTAAQAEPFPLPEKEDYVLYFGRYSQEKGVATLLDACRALPDITFKFAGGGDFAAEIEALPNAENLGFLSGETLRSAIARARFSIMPSACYENCPFSVIESIIYRTPVIGARIGGIPELIDEGVTGLLFESLDAADLRDKISALWSDRALTDEMSANCAHADFLTAQTYCEKLTECYDALLKED